jgi:hypothetical protein
MNASGRLDFVGGGGNDTLAVLNQDAGGFVFLKNALNPIENKSIDVRFAAAPLGIEAVGRVDEMTSLLIIVFPGCAQGEGRDHLRLGGNLGQLPTEAKK